MPPPSSASHELPSEILEMFGRVQDQAMIFSLTVDENNENARYPYASPGAQAVYGVSAEEVMSDAMELVGRIHDDDKPAYFSSMEESWKQLSEWNFTWRSCYPGYPNNYKWLKASSMPKRLPNGHTIWYGAVYDADAETRLGDSEKRQTESAASNRLLQSENDSVSNKYAHAFDLLNDVVFAVRATSWEAADWRVYESSKSFGDYFQLGGVKRFLDTVDDAAVLRELLAAARHEKQPIRDLAVFKPTHSSNERTLRCRAVDLSGVEGFTSVLVVCHDLTDFKFRIEAEKDRQVAAKLQHEDKNLHKSHEVSASYALEQLGIIEKQLIVEAGGALPKEFASDSEQEAGLLVGEDEGIWGSVSDAEERAAILSEFRRGVRRTLDDLLALLDARDVGALPDELHHLLGQCRAVGARRIQLAVGKCKSAFDYGKLVGLEELLAETFEAMDARCGGEPLESTAAQCSHAKQLAYRLAPLVGGPPDNSPPSATPSKHSSVLPPSQPLQRPQRDNTDALPLVNWEIARALGDALNAACVECESTLEKLHKALVSCGEQCELLLRSLVGSCEQIGATRMARLVVDFESRHTEFGPLQLDALRTLHAETLSALSAPEGLLAASASALRGTTLSALSAPDVVAGASALRGTSPPRTSRLKPAEEGLFVAVVDDSAFSRKIFEATLLPALGADAQRSKAIGGTREEQVGFISFALGLVDASLHDLPPPHRQADVVLIDENLALDGEVHLSGSYVLARLREQGYVGVACLASSCDREQLARLMAVPGVDLVSPKPFHASALAAALLKAHEVKQLVTSAHATQEKRAPFAEKLVSLTHLEGLPHSSIRSLMDVAYNNATEPSSRSSAGKRPRFLSASSIYAKLAQLEKRFQQSESIDRICHSLKGVAKTAGACRLAKEVEAFPANPTTAGIAQMWSLLDATRSKLLATGYLSLPSDSVSPTLPHIAHRWKKNHSSFSA